MNENNNRNNNIGTNSDIFNNTNNQNNNQIPNNTELNSNIPNMLMKFLPERNSSNGFLISSYIYHLRIKKPLVQYMMDYLMS